jgi:hypothetical protein
MSKQAKHRYRPNIQNDLWQVWLTLQNRWYGFWKPKLRRKGWHV